MIVVVEPGLLTTVQDAGRPGHRAFGLPAAGAMDWLCWALANQLAGNSPGAAALEMTLLGGRFLFERAAHVGLCGADMQARLDGTPVGPAAGFAVGAGSELAFGATRAGARAYLAVRGGLDVPVVLGSRSTFLRGAFGGFAGRAVAAGDRLPIGRARGAAPPSVALPDRLIPAAGGEVLLRAIPGPQDSLFTREGLATFFGATFVVTNRNDRMGYLLEGPTVEHAGRVEILSDPVLPGAVQVPADGRPIVLTADAQTTGGYPKIATVIGPDLRRLAQARAGDRVRFGICTDREALGALIDERRTLEAVAALQGA